MSKIRRGRDSFLRSFVRLNQPYVYCYNNVREKLQAEFLGIPEKDSRPAGRRCGTRSCGEPENFRFPQNPQKTLHGLITPYSYTYYR